jgi:hypothetical protein
MNLSDDQLLEIERLSALLLNPDEIAVMIHVDIDLFLEQISLKSGEIYHAYFRGKTITKKEIHDNVLKMAKRGSPQAEEMARQMIIQQNSSEKRAKK